MAPFNNEFKATNTKAYLDQYQPAFVIDSIKCRACALWETSFSAGTRRSGVYGRGTGRNGIYFIGEGLGAREVQHGIPFIDDAGELLTRLLNEVRIPENECFITNIVRCRPPENRAPTADEQRLCMTEHVLKDLPPTAPKIVVLLGNTPLKAILGLTKITERRGIWYEGEYAGHKVKILPTFHPANILRKPAFYDTVKADLIKVREALIEMQTPGAPRVSELPKLHREYISSKDRFLMWMRLLAEYPSLILVNDLETTGLHAFQHNESVLKEVEGIPQTVIETRPRDSIVSCSFVFELDGEWYGIAFITQQGVKEIIKEVRDDEGRVAVPRQIFYYSKEEWWWADLQDPEIFTVLQTVLRRDVGIIFHNEDFDVKMWWAHGYRTHCYIDTLDEHLMIDENSLHGLKFLTSRYLIEGGGYEQEIYDYVGGDKGKLSEVPTQILLKYNLNDAYYTGILERYKFTPQVQSEGTWDFFMGHAMPLRRALTCMSWRGILLDRDRVLDMSDTYRAAGQLLEQELFDLVKRKFNYNSTQQLAEVLHGPQGLKLPIFAKTDKGAPSTSKEALTELAKLHPAPALIEKIRHKRKMLSTYLDGRSWPDFNGEIKDTGGLIKFLDERNRLHCDFLTSGTISGRLAARDPSLLNIPRDPEIRMNFMAPEGWSFIDKDYSQAELVLLAYLAEDPGFIAAVNSDDMHQHVLDKLIIKARLLLEKWDANNVSAKDRRNVAKSVNFRKAYRGGSEGLAEQLGLQPEETAQWYEEWDAAFWKIPIWWQKMEREWRDRRMIDGEYGRKKHFPPALDRRTESYFDRLSANFPCQNGVADTTNRAIFLFEKEMDNLFGWDIDRVLSIPGIVLAVHDNIIAEAPDEIVPQINDLLDYYMRLPLPNLGIQLKVDTHIVKRWGQDEYEKQLKEKAARDEKITIDEEMERIRR